MRRNGERATPETVRCPRPWSLSTVRGGGARRTSLNECVGWRQPVAVANAQLPAHGRRAPGQRRPSKCVSRPIAKVHPRQKERRHG